MSYNLRRDDGAETQGESAEEAANLMRGLEDAEAGEAEPLRGELARILRLQSLRRSPLYQAVTGGPDTETRHRFHEGKKMIRLPNFWPRADSDVVDKTVKEASDAIGK